MRWALLFLTLSACKGDGEDSALEMGEPSGCDPTDETRCAMPWPSGYFQAPDETTASGVRNQFGPESLVIDRDGARLQPDMLNDKDGFATLTPMVVGFEDIDSSNLLSHTDLGAYTSDDVTTVVVNAATGERLPHFAEMDMSAPEDERMLILRPVTPMEHGTRYVVGIRGLKHLDGSDVQPSAAFRGLRDNDDSAQEEVARMRDRYENGIFDVLEQTGFSRAQLQLAWDFTTGSSENLHADILHIRDDALARIPKTGPVFEIDSVEVDPYNCTTGESIHKTIEGRVTVPYYTEQDGPASVFARGADGLPTYQGDADPNFLIRIPCSVYNDPSSARMVLQYGHGLLGDRGEARTGWLSEFADREGLIVFAMNWTGMSTIDATPIALMIATDLSNFRFIPERSQQGLVEFSVGARMMQTSMVGHEELTYDGVSLLEGLPIGYYGNSQGGILGAAYMSVTPDIDRGVLGVAGMPYSILLTRSADFDPFFLLFKEKYTDHRDITLILGIMQTLWDAGEPSGFAHKLNRDPLPGTPAKDVLIQVAYGDAQVTTLGAHVMARSFDAATVAPQTKAIWGVDEMQPGFSGSALVEYLYTDVPDEPIANVPPDKDFDTHECPRRERSGQDQALEFLLDGVITHTCDGPCISIREGLCD